MSKVTEKSLDLINQACALMAQEHYDAALVKFQQAQADSPQYFDCYIHLGNVYSCLEKYDDALDNFKKALMLDENSALALFDIGNVLYLKGEKYEALKYYSRADASGKMTADMYDVIAGMYKGEGDYTQALRYINRAVKLDPMHGEYYLEKAQIYVDQQKPDEALEALQEFHQLFPDAYEAYDMLSAIYMIKKDFAGALDIVEQGIARFEKDVNLAYLKLKVLCEFAKDTEAMQYIETLRENGMYAEKKADFAILEANIYLKNQEIEKATQCLEDSVDGDYSQAEVAFLLCTIYMKTERYEKVVEISEKMLESEISLFYAATAKFCHAQAKLLKGDQDTAYKELREITKEFRKITILNPSFYEGYAYRLLAHKDLKEYDEALNLAEYMKNLFPDRPDGYVFAYTIYKDMNEMEKAEKEKRTALEINPSFIF